MRFVLGWRMELGMGIPIACQHGSATNVLWFCLPPGQLALPKVLEAWPLLAGIPEPTQDLVSPREAPESAICHRSVVPRANVCTLDHSAVTWGGVSQCNTMGVCDSAAVFSKRPGRQGQASLVWKTPGFCVARGMCALEAPE